MEADRGEVTILLAKLTKGNQEKLDRSCFPWCTRRWGRVSSALWTTPMPPSYEVDNAESSRQNLTVEKSWGRDPLPHTGRCQTPAWKETMGPRRVPQGAARPRRADLRSLTAPSRMTAGTPRPSPNQLQTAP
jgi:hypothetical protein